MDALRKFLLDACDEEELRTMGRTALVKRKQEQRLGHKNRLLRQNWQAVQAAQWSNFLAGRNPWD